MTGDMSMDQLAPALNTPGAPVRLLGRALEQARFGEAEPKGREALRRIDEFCASWKELALAVADLVAGVDRASVSPEHLHKRITMLKNTAGQLLAHADELDAFAASLLPAPGSG
jgi:hypothetical protein